MRNLLRICGLQGTLRLFCPLWIISSQRIYEGLSEFLLSKNMIVIVLSCATQIQGMFNVDPGNYELSRPMEYFDDFLSHDWRTSRWLKLMSMLIVYNSRAALVAMCIASIAMGIVRVYVESPEDPMLNLKLTLIAVVICHGVHLVFLCFWQRFCSLLLTPTFVFLDKLCIAQSPELAERKAKGILGLAAFLNHSRRLVVPRWILSLT